MTDTSTSCPRCGVGAPAEASRCRDCGFTFFEAPPRRSLPRPSPRWLLVAVAAVAAGVVIAVLLGREGPAPPPQPVSPARAEQRLEGQLAAADIDDASSVRCQDSVRVGRSTRCEVLYADGDTQLLLVSLAADGELEVDVPYPAQRRPGG